jgi:hypothetical protein
MFWLGTGLTKLPDLEMHQILLNFAKESVSVLFMMFIYALDENIRIGGVGWHTNVHQPTKAQA